MIDDPIVKNLYMKKPSSDIMQIVDKQLRAWANEGDFIKINEVLEHTNTNRIETEMLILLAKSTFEFKSVIEYRSTFITKAKKLVIKRNRPEVLKMLEE